MAFSDADHRPGHIPFSVFRYEDPPTSEAEWNVRSAEWEAHWEEFIRLAREYGWPEDYIQAYLQSHRVSYRERMASIATIRELHEAGRYTDAHFENKRTMMREPGNPADNPFR